MRDLGTIVPKRFEAKLKPDTFTVILAFPASRGLFSLYSACGRKETSAVGWTGLCWASASVCWRPNYDVRWRDTLNVCARLRGLKLWSANNTWTAASSKTDSTHRRGLFSPARWIQGKEASASREILTVFPLQSRWRQNPWKRVLVRGWESYMYI